MNEAQGTVSEGAKKIGALSISPAEEVREPAAPPPEVREPPNPEEAAPAPEQPSGETQDQPEPQAEQPEPIEPPASWDDAAKERFRKLPRDDQEYLNNRERERDLAVRRGQDENAKARKAIEAEHANAVQQASQYVTQLNFAAQALHQQLLGDFPDIKTPADLAKLATDDPQRYLSYDARQKQVQAAYQQVAQHQQFAQQQEQKKLSDWIAEEARKLPDLVPEWKDHARAAKEINEVRSYAVTQGLSQDEANQPWSAAAVSMARKAMLWDKAQKATAAAKVQNLPKVVKPGTAGEPGEAERTRAEALRKTHSKTGSVDSAANALRALRTRRAS